MTSASPQSIIHSDPPVYRQHIEKIAGDRNALLAIKLAIEEMKRDLKKKHGAKFPSHVYSWNQELTRRLEIVDTALRHVRARNNPALARTGGAPAWIYSLVVSDDDGNDYFQVASMLNPPKFHARECRTADHVEKIPVILQFLQQEDLDAIPVEMWDDTCPLNKEEEHTEPQYELFGQ